MTSKINLNSSENENTCVVCFKTVDIYSVGDCDHPVCYECSTRMRVLCCQNECPICRNDMPKVIYTAEVLPFRRLKTRAAANMLDRKYGIYFTSMNIQNKYWTLLEHTCSICNLEPFRSFYLLKEHMRRQHELFYCDLCSQNLKIFSFERRCYTRSQLAIHRRKGDPDDKSHKGHPLCEFCDARYMDSDELYRHLRRDHLYCHFCDADGMHHYYSSYEYLKQHFQSEHFLCEEGDCRDEQFTSVFRTDIDLKAHRTIVHGKQLGKVGAKQARTLELEFRLAPRPRSDPPSQTRPRVPPPCTFGQHLGAVNEEWVEDEGAVGFDTEPGGTVKQNTPINVLDPELFPSLNGSESPVLSSVSSKPLTRSNAGGSGITIRHMRNHQGLAKTNENFPALSSDTSNSSTVRLSVNSNSDSRPTMRASISKAPNVSIHVNHRGNTGLTTRISQNSTPVTNNNAFQAPPHPTEDFPALGNSVPNQTAQWISQKSKEIKPKPSKVASAPVLPSSKNFHNDFPTLTKPVNTSNQKKSDQIDNVTKKSSSVVVPVTSSYSSEESSRSSETKTKNKKKKSKNSIVNNSTVVSTNDFNKKTTTTTISNNNSGALDNKSNSTTSTSNKKKTKVELNTTPKETNTNNKKQSDNRVAQNGTVERKKSELNIGKLKTPALNGELSAHDFPVLGSNASCRKPPGFTDQPIKAPPGFGHPPPPGFNNCTAAVNSIANSANNLIFTNSSGEKFPILPNNLALHSNNLFYSPPNFTQRNTHLIDNFVGALSGDDLNEFRQFSQLFREGLYSAQAYYEQCQKALGKQFENIFPELLVLLPDIQKQRELYGVHSMRGSDSKSFKNLETCATCGQVVVNSDFKHHLANHTLENHFPVLGKISANDVSTAWKK